MYTIFTPIFYINNKPHIGHMLTIKISNFYKRLLTIRRKYVECYTGTDEHGEKVQNSFVEYAIIHKIKHITEYIQIRRQEFSDIFNILTQDKQYIYHTFSDVHIINIEHIFDTLYQLNFIYKGKYEGKYSLKDEKYIDDIEYKSLSDTDKKFVITKQEEGFYLNMQLYKQQIKDSLHNTILNKNYMEYCTQIIDNTQDIFITRAGNRKTTHAVYIRKYNVFIYVWFEAIMYYIITIKREPYTHKNILIIIGKDIINFHIVLLPTLSYMLLNTNPFKVIVHGLICLDNIKVSKSYNNFIHANEIVQQYGNIVFSAFLANGINKDFNLDTNIINTYINFVKHNIRNCYKRYYKVLEQYYEHIIQHYNTIQTQSLYTDTYTQIYNIVNEIFDNDNLINTHTAFNYLNKLSGMCNSLMDTQQFWIFEIQKSTHLICAFKIIKCMLYLEYVLQHDGIEEMLQLLNVNITNNILNCEDVIKIVHDLNIFNLVCHTQH